jgi:phage head maturation protease
MPSHPGGGLKSLDDSGRVGGYLVLFGHPGSTDASQDRDYFTAETDFGLDVMPNSRAYYDHGLDPRLGNRVLGVFALEADAVGVWAEGELHRRDAYEERVYALVKAGKLGLSSGTSGHLVRKVRQPNGSHRITSWPLGLDASLTPAPAEPRTLAVAMKGLGRRASPAEVTRLRAAYLFIEAREAGLLN